jgi:hypothetical protein
MAACAAVAATVRRRPVVVIVVVVMMLTGRVVVIVIVRVAVIVIVFQAMPMVVMVVGMCVAVIVAVFWVMGVVVRLWAAAVGGQYTQAAYEHRGAKCGHDQARRGAQPWVDAPGIHISRGEEGDQPQGEYSDGMGRRDGKAQENRVPGSAS